MGFSAALCQVPILHASRPAWICSRKEVLALILERKNLLVCLLFVYLFIHSISTFFMVRVKMAI